MYSFTGRLNVSITFSTTVLSYMVVALALTSIFLTTPQDQIHSKISVNEIKKV